MINRATDHAKRWPQNIPAVITQKFQFSSFNAGDPNATKFPTPSMPKADWDAFLLAQEAVTNATVSDPSMGANHYHSYTDPEEFPTWADATKIVAKMGVFTFYKL